MLSRLPGCLRAVAWAAPLALVMADAARVRAVALQAAPEGAAATATRAPAGAAASGADVAPRAEVEAMSGAAAASARAEVEALLGEQAAAWNRGDLAAFTSIYADDATFVSPSGIRHGREAVLARYRERYPDRRAMGRLELQPNEARPLGYAAPAQACDGGPASAATAVAASAPSGSRVASLSIVARWRLTYPDDPARKAAEGWTLLVFQRRDGRWQILQDVSL